MNTRAATFNLLPTRVKDMWPAVGLRLGRRTADTLELGLVFDPEDEVLGVPVHKVGRRWKLHRPGGAGADKVQADDVGRLVQRWKADAPLRVDIAIWQEAGRDGVLFMMLNTRGMPDGSNARIAEGLNGRMDSMDPIDLELSIVPSTAVPPRAAPPGGHGLAAPQRDDGRSPASVQQRLRVVLASCQYTVGLLDGTPGGERLEPGPGDASFARLLQRLDTTGWRRPDALILTGDQVYVDATAGLFDPIAVSGSHDAPYRRLLESRYARNVLRQLPVCPLIDDHEIVNNYEPSDIRFENDSLDRVRRKGRKAYIRHQRQVSLLRRIQEHETELWDSIEISGFHFFCADTRTQRAARTVEGFVSSSEPRPHILGRAQLDALITWLKARQGDDRPCFVVSPSTFLPRKLQTLESDVAALRSDAWDGYPASMQVVLDTIADVGCKVIFLSGDEHRCLLTSARCEVDARGLQVHSVHSSALYAPYPFANARPEDFAVSGDRIETSGNRTWAVEGEVMPAGDGYCVIDVAHDDKGWRVDLQYDLAGQADPVERCFRP
jgi:hypothetical protein